MNNETFYVFWMYVVHRVRLLRDIFIEETGGGGGGIVSEIVKLDE